MKTLPRILLGALLLTAVFAGTAEAADEGPQYEGVPSYSVTRLKIFEGSVWVRTPDSGEWEEFPNNSPVPERARLSVPEDSEAELQFHGGQFMLLTGGTELDLQRLEDGITVFRFRAGEIRFDLPEEDFSPVRVLVPGDARVEFPVPGKYWLIAAGDEDPRLVVRAGEATVATDGGEQPVRRGEEARIGRDVSVGPYAGGPGEERHEEAGMTDQERQAGVPPSAAYELRDYGEWVESPEYGYVWRPRVAPGWTPYYYGQWVWISPYGWTWISSEPWGWYPYHYGYWYTDPLFGWGWYPFHSFVSVNFLFGGHRYPHYYRRAYFVPATVRFVGSGSTVRWVPLRPGERYPRIRYTRADRRLAHWEKPLPARTVYVRRKGPTGREWADWKAVGRRPGGDRKVRASVRPEPARERPSSREVRPERKSAPGREGVRERQERPGAVRVPPERERIREQPDRPPARRMERMERPNQESRRVPAGRTDTVSRRERRGPRPEPTVARPNRAVPDRRSYGRTESPRGVSRGRESMPTREVPAATGGDRTRGAVDRGGWIGRGGGAVDRGGGFRWTR